MIRVITELQKLWNYRSYGLTEVPELKKLKDFRNYGVTEITT